jgi:hypothetical protein
MKSETGGGSLDHVAVAACRMILGGSHNLLGFFIGNMTLPRRILTTPYNLLRCLYRECGALKKDTRPRRG